MGCGVQSLMARNELLKVLFFFLIVFGGSHASLGLELRKLVGVDPKVDNTANGIHGSPSPASNPTPIDELGNNNKMDTPSTNTTQKGDPMVPNNSVSPVPPPGPNTGNTTSASPPPVTESNDQKSPEKGQTFSQMDTTENCDHLSKCRDDGEIVACISESESKYLVVIVQNGGNSTVQVKLSMESNIGDIEVAQHSNKKVNIPVTSSESTKLTLNAGKGECVLHLRVRVPEEGPFLRLPSYEKFLTPVNGAYFLIISVLVLGGTWVCCKFRNKRHDGVPYQELEMALPESVSATSVEITEGWDQDWDDNWDEDVAVKSPGGPHAGSISANGLTARSSNKDGWENDWVD